MRHQLHPTSSSVPASTVAAAWAPPHFPVPSVGVPLLGGSLPPSLLLQQLWEQLQCWLPTRTPTSAPVSSSLHPLRPSVGPSGPAKKPCLAGASPRHPHSKATDVFSLSTAPLQLLGWCLWILHTVIVPAPSHWGRSLEQDPSQVWLPTEGENYGVSHITELLSHLLSTQAKKGLGRTRAFENWDSAHTLCTLRHGVRDATPWHDGFKWVLSSFLEVLS